MTTAKRSTLSVGRTTGRRLSLSRRSLEERVMRGQKYIDLHLMKSHLKTYSIRHLSERLTLEGKYWLQQLCGRRECLGCTIGLSSLSLKDVQTISNWLDEICQWNQTQCLTRRRLRSKGRGRRCEIQKRRRSGLTVSTSR